MAGRRAEVTELFALGATFASVVVRLSRAGFRVDHFHVVILTADIAHREDPKEVFLVLSPLGGDLLYPRLKVTRKYSVIGESVFFKVINEGIELTDSTLDDVGLISVIADERH